MTDELIEAENQPTYQPEPGVTVIPIPVMVRVRPKRPPRPAKPESGNGGARRNPDR
jgi:hypothetical protein